MNWIPVESSNIKEMAFEVGVGDVKNILSVNFTKTGIYHYLGVPEELFKRMLSAHSVGKFFSENIKNKFDYWKAAPDERFVP